MEREAKDSLADDASLSRLYGRPPPLGSGGAVASALGLSALDRALLHSIDAAWRCGLQADLGPAATAASAPTSLSASLSAFAQSLAALDSAARQCDARVPLALLASMDDGRNPEAVLSAALKDASDHNDRVRGQVVAARALQGALSGLQHSHSHSHSAVAHRAKAETEDVAAGQGEVG